MKTLEPQKDYCKETHEIWSSHQGPVVGKIAEANNKKIKNLNKNK